MEINIFNYSVTSYEEQIAFSKLVGGTCVCICVYIHICKYTQGQVTRWATSKAAEAADPNH